MASWIVMQPAGVGRATGTTNAAFIRDGFSLLAFLVPPLWLLWHRLWIEAALAFAVLLMAAVIGRATGVATAASLISLLVSIFVGLEGNGLRIAALLRRGWRNWGVVDAGNLDDAETCYATAIASDDGVPDQAPMQLSVNAGPANPVPIPPIGFLLNPGR
jgi:hypothetical protein